MEKIIVKEPSMINEVLKLMFDPDAKPCLEIKDNGEVVINAGIKFNNKLKSFELVKDKLSKKCNHCFGLGKIQDPNLPSANDPSSGDLFGCGFLIECPTCKGVGKNE